MRRHLPALGLFALAPLVAELLQGNIAIDALGIAIFFAPLYRGGGGGATSAGGKSAAFPLPAPGRRLF